MLLFKHHHVPLILNGDKTQTRRKWPKGLRAIVGSVHECKTRLFGPGSEPFARVRILKVYRERLGDMPDEDYRKEGLYTCESFQQVWTDINGSYDSEEVVWVVEFEMAAKLVCPAA